jgi:filamentous hemagglutinin
LAGKPLELVDQNGAKVLRLVGDSTTEPATAKTPEKSVGAGSEARSTGNVEPTAEHSSEPEPAKKPTSSSPEHGDANLAAADAEGGPAKWVDERAHMSGDARSYQDTAHGARSNTTTRAPQAPELEYKASDGSVQKVRFDGVDGRVMIDRKKSVTTFPKSERQALRQSEALKQNGLTAVWEVPTVAEAARAAKMLSKLGISNITIRVVRP